MNKRAILKGTILSCLLIFLYIFLVFPLDGVINPNSILNQIKDTQHLTASVPPIGRLFGMLKSQTESQKSAYIGGFPIAMALYTDGVIIEDISTVDTEFGKSKPCQQLMRGDFLIDVDGNKIQRAGDIERLLNGHKDDIDSNPQTEPHGLIDLSPDIDVLDFDDIKKEEEKGSAVTVVVLRSGEKKTFSITPAIEIYSNKKRLGLVVRDYILGIGMTSYIKQDGSFGALGHPVSDAIAGRVPIRSGHIFNCQEISIIKGEKGKPGEFRVKINSLNKPIGEIFRNDEHGVFGKFDSIEEAQKCHLQENKNLFPISKSKKVCAGNAMICTTIAGKTDFYKIEIIKASHQNSLSDKGLIIRITDKRLIEKTGGIIQGMSGSPIIQNGMLVGAVTHVFVNDPSKGYGIYLDFMCEK